MAGRAQKDSRKVALARAMRKAPTEPEQLLWQRLRLCAEPGVKFRRQHPFGPYILDFYCAKAGLCVEVDGHAHSEESQAMRDEVRDHWLNSKRVEVYRIPAAEVYRNADNAADGVILKAITRVKGS